MAAPPASADRDRPRFPVVVMKFGGTSVQDAPALRRLVAAVAAEPRRRIVVVSALAGVTDALCQLADGGMRGGAAAEALLRLRGRHDGLARELVHERLLPGLLGKFGPIFDTAERLATLPRRLRTPADRDALLAAGELASSELVAAVLASAGIPASRVDAREVVVTDASHGSAKPDTAAIHDASLRLLLPLVAANRVPVLGGFIGSASGGATTTLGRGGSDYSSALVAAGIGAAEVQIWTDVDGVFAADPRAVKRASLVARLSFREAYELARFGAKVLHWGTLEPAAAHRIPVRVLRSGAPRGSGTVIDAKARRGAGLAGMALQDGMTVADIRARGVRGSARFLEAALGWLERDGRGLTIVSMSPDRVVVAAAAESEVAALVAAVADAAETTVTRDAALVAVVGDRVTAHAGAWSAVGRALDAGQVKSVVATPSGDALVCIASGSAGRRLLVRLHDELFGGVPAARARGGATIAPPAPGALDATYQAGGQA